MSEISTLEPQAVWVYFDQITQIPRPSKSEERIIAYLIDFAKSHNLEYRKDATGNVVIRKPATKGMERCPTVILQSHVDMVCEKNSDISFDFTRDSIRTRIVDGWVKATGTTLGADCGMGMAAELALLASVDVPHGALECLFTVDEETGLTGAFGLAPDMLSGKYLINLDSEDEGQIFIGCAGGIDTVATFNFRKEEPPKNYLFFRLDVSGLLGGHSGDDIDKGRANSNKVLTRFLWMICAQDIDLRLTYFDGGNLRNAIPREAFAVFGIPAREEKGVRRDFEAFRQALQQEYGTVEPHLDVALSEMPAPDAVIDPQTQSNLLNGLCGLPNGVLAMSPVMPGMVETSTNLASVKFVGELLIEVTTSQRSSIQSARDAAAASVESVFRLAGAHVSHSSGYPGWTPNPSSHLLDITRRAYERLFDRPPVVRSIHAGLECGLFLEKYPSLEMVSFGPTLRGVHSPDERLEIASVDKFWRLLLEVIASLKTTE